MNEREHTRFLDMLTESQRVQEFLAGRQQEELFTDMLLAYAVVRAIGIVGEAASQVSPETRLAYPDVPWRNIIGMRNRIVHGYSSVDWNIVWEVATRNLPALMPILEEILRKVDD